ncbi:DUF2459 domain-containing protein [Ramlibacter sp. AW1]|uniref:DUF2459 domain-containing protein n=1 Tax=Ramlibacter aurantiacus TaxID=2801330 RepID=A0A936ZS82_9BURK|nr:DUF2459 domain-containing protein [Ramlibacter aurantiacus]MBL0422716.1 DUF2459 domain-containing protein [Ramlibacter aurantiacus]
MQAATDKATISDAHGGAGGDRKAGAMTRLLLVLLAALTTACAAPSSMPPPAQRTVWLVRHGWHTGLVFRTADLPADSPLRLPRASHVEVGWGDRAYYMHPSPGIVLGLRALLWPTPGVLHLVALPAAPPTSLAGAEMATVGVTQEALERMHQRVLRSLTDAGLAQPLGPGLYGDSAFHASVDEFHALRTCNVWVAQLLREGGVRVRPAGAITAGALMRQVDAAPPAPLQPAPSK